jgi:hypothetical protein
MVFASLELAKAHCDYVGDVCAGVTQVGGGLFELRKGTVVRTLEGQLALPKSWQKGGCYACPNDRTEDGYLICRDRRR